jgi:preprotein translocase subunit YajC
MGQAGEIATQVALVLFVLALAYSLLVRPQLKRMAEHQSFLASLRVGDRVVTRGGLIGNVAAIEDAVVVSLALSDVVTVSIERSGIERRLSRT